MTLTPSTSPEQESDAWAPEGEGSHDRIWKQVHEMMGEVGRHGPAQNQEFPSDRERYNSDPQMRKKILMEIREKLGSKQMSERKLRTMQESYGKNVLGTQNPEPYDEMVWNQITLELQRRKNKKLKNPI